MALVWSAVLDRHIARTSVAQRRQLTGLSAGSSLSQPRGIRRPLGSFSAETALAPVAWLRGFREFVSPSPKPCTARGGDTLTYPEQMVALGRVVASTRGVLAAQAHVAAHEAARSHSI